jgi:hypothetical protein
MPRFKAVFADGSEEEGEARDLARFVVELAARPRGPSDLVLAADVDAYTRLAAAQEPPAAEPAPPRRRK